jgi:hypothetical protein
MKTFTNVAWKQLDKNYQNSSIWNYRKGKQIYKILFVETFSGLQHIDSSPGKPPS